MRSDPKPLARYQSMAARFMPSWESSFMIPRAWAQASQIVNSIPFISRYLIRAPFSVEKIRYCARKGSVIYRTKMVKGPNRNFQVYDPLTFLAAATSHIPDRGEPLVRYYSWYSSVQRGKRRKLGLEEPIPRAPPEPEQLPDIEYMPFLD